jgi:hypothetical protein
VGACIGVLSIDEDFYTSTTVHSSRIIVRIIMSSLHVLLLEAHSQSFTSRITTNRDANEQVYN